MKAVGSSLYQYNQSQAEICINLNTGVIRMYSKCCLIDNLKSKVYSEYMYIFDSFTCSLNYYFSIIVQAVLTCIYPSWVVQYSSI